MSAHEVSVDESTETAWVEFRRELADRLAGLTSDDVVVVAMEPGERPDDDRARCAPYVQAIGDDDGYGVAEAVSNHFLDRRHRLVKASRHRLRELGWQRPEHGFDTLNYWLRFDLSHADEVAVLMVRALREVFGVVHPAFLAAPFASADRPPAEGSAQPASWDATPALDPVDRDHLDQLVDDALTPVFGRVPSRDGDGDIAVTSGSAVVYVRVLESRPMVHLFAELAVGVTELDRARFEVSVLNRDWTFVKFVLSDDVVRADLFLPAAPFAPEHLRQALAMMCEMADAVDDDLAFRVGGRTFLTPAEPGGGDL
jgi:hypothetical protein